MAVLGVPSGPIGFVAALGFKILDSQPEKSNMGPVWTDFQDFEHFQKRCRSFLALYLPCFGLGSPKTGFQLFDRCQKYNENCFQKRIFSFPMTIFRKFSVGPPNSSMLDTFASLGQFSGDPPGSIKIIFFDNFE